MIDQDLHSLRVWMIISIVLYSWGIVNFTVFRKRLIVNINRFSERFFGDRYPALPESSENFWIVLVISMMLMLVAICLFVAIDPAQYLSMVVIVLVSKFSSTTQYIFRFRKERHFAHIVGAITDGPLFIITLIYYIMAANQ